jgi:hypothetical protein
MSAGSGEKKRLEQFLLQSRASNILLIDPRYSSFQPEKIDTIRLRAVQREAGKKPISEKLIKQQENKKKKARRGKQLRGEVSRAVREQKRFERGERRDRPEDEPRIVGEPRNTGLAYDPDIERRRLDIQEQANRDANLRVLAQARRDQLAQERELAVRRGELASARAERRLERQRLAPPAPLVIPAPNIRIEAPPPAQVRVDPTINIPALPARADADPIPEIQRLGQLIRADVDAFGAEQTARNEDLFAQIRRQAQRQGELEARQVVIDEQQRQRILAQDAQYEEFQTRLGLQNTAMGQARDAVIAEINAAEQRLRQGVAELNRPVNYDDVILRAVNQNLEGQATLRRPVEIEEITPTPERREPEPEEPSGIEALIAGGGELQLPNVVVERPGRIAPDESLRLSPVRPEDRPGSIETGINPQTGRPYRIERLPGTAGPTEKRAGGAQPLRAQQLVDDPTPQAPPPSPELQLEELQPVDVADALRASRLELPDELPVSGAVRRAQERLEAGAPLPGDADRLFDQQDFLAGFETPPALREARALRSPLPPILGGASEADVALQALLAQAVPFAEEPPTPSPTPRARTPQRAGQETPSTPEEEAVLEELRAVDEQPLQPVAQGIAQFGGAIQPAPARVIEDAGIVAQAEERIADVDTSQEEAAQPADLRPLDPDVLFEPIEEAEQVGEIQDQRPQAIRDSSTLFQNSQAEIASQLRTGPRGSRGQRGGLGYRVKNNTDRTLKKVQPGDVVNVIGVEQGASGEGRYRLDTQTQAGTRVGLDQLQPLIDDGSFIFERGHRHELGGHFDAEPYGPPPAEPLLQAEGGLGQAEGGLGQEEGGE